MSMKKVYVLCLLHKVYICITTTRYGNEDHTHALHK